MHADPGARDRAGLQAAQADAAGAGLRQGDPAQRARGRLRRAPTRPRPTGCCEEWDERNLDVPLKVLHSPYRELVRPIVDYAMEIKKANPRGVVAVYIPEYVVGRWWEQLLHNQTALRLKGRLLFAPGVMVTSVPYQLRSSQIAREREERELPGCAPATCAAARSARPASADRGPGAAMTRRPRPAPGPRPLPGRRALRGRRRPGRARRPLRRPAARTPESRASSSPGTRSRGSGWSSRSPRAPRATGSGAATPSRCSRPSPDRVDRAVPVRRPGPLRRLRLPARGAAAPARAQGRRRPRAAVPPGRARRAGRGRAGRRATTDGLRWRTRVQFAARPRRPAGDAQAPLAARSSRSTTA